MRSARVLRWLGSRRQHSASRALAATARARRGRTARVTGRDQYRALVGALKRRFEVGTEAVMPRAHRATRHESVPAAEVTVLVDVDEASWWSWNRYASAFAEANQATVTNIDDGGIAGPAFFDHVARLRRPVLDSPKRHTAPMPPTLTRRPIRSPVPLWAWALLHRADDTRPMVARATRTLVDHASALGWQTLPSEPHWPPASPSKA